MPEVLICSYLEPHYIKQIESVDPCIRIHFEPELIPAPRYKADHVGAPFERTFEQQRQWIKLMQEAEVLFDFDYVRPQNILEHGKRVRWVQASSSGIGQFLKRYGLLQKNITFTTAAGIHARPLAEFVVWAMLSFIKAYPLAKKQQQAHVWKRFHGDELEGKTLAIVGLGSIGKMVAFLASQLGVRTIGCKRNVEGISPGSLHVERVYAWTELEDMLANADFVCLACPHTDETAGLMNQTRLARMKKGSVLINIGRGALVDHEALLGALRNGPIAGAVLDVVSPEPLSSDSPLWDMDNVILFPHSASTSVRENERLTELFCQNLKRYLRGEPLLNQFDSVRLY